MNDHHKQNDAAAGTPVSARTALVITRFEKPASDGPMTKRIWLDVNGELASDGGGGGMWRGTAQTLTVLGASGLAKAIDACTSQQAFAPGVLKPQFDNGVAVRDVVRDEKLLTAPAGTIARTKEQFEFKAGQPAAMPLDYDPKGMPGVVELDFAMAGGFWGAVLEVAPGLADAARVTRASTSAGLKDTTTGKSFPGSGGLHVYVLVQDGDDIPRAVKALHDRATLKRYGWGWISKAGLILERSIVDASKGAAHDLSYEGPPVLTPPLAQDMKAREAVAVEGALIDTRLAIPDLTAGERVRLTAIRATEKQRLEPEARKVRDAWVEKHVAQARKAGSPLSDDVLRQRFAGAYGGRLPPDFVLAFDDPVIGEITVAAVLADIQRFAGETLADPLEGVSYGRCKAKVMPPKAGDEAWIHSFAHGGMKYQLLLDQAALRQMIESAPRDQAVEVLLRNIDRTALFAGGEEDLIEKCAATSGRNKMEIKRLLKAHREQRERERIERLKLLRKLTPDPRPAIRAPAGDAELGVFSDMLDELLAASIARVPAFRGVNGKLMVVIEEPVDGLHLLDAANVNPVDAAGVEAGLKAPPAREPSPPEVRTVELANPIHVAIEIERHVRFMRVRKDSKETVYVRADPPVCDAINGGKVKSLLPRVKGVQTLPLVLRRRDGSFEIVMNEGVDRRLGFYMRVDPALRAILPDPSKITLADVTAAYAFLTDEWLVDVDGDATAKAVLVSIPLTMIQRMTLSPERPGYMVNAALQGAGKTTVIHMITLAVLGRLAAAAAWAGHEEEIRKAMFAYLSAGTPLLVWDNIKRGSRITSSTAERALTSEFISDRILGQSVVNANAPAHTVQVWTGNDIGPRGEMSNRCIVATLRASRPDPENRAFIHPDPIQWTLDHRLEILKALYTILCAPRAIANGGKTRMKAWWRAVGQPIEIAAGVDFAAVVKANNEGDPTMGALERIVSWLQDEFGSNSFEAQDVAKGLRLDPAAVFGTNDEQDAAQAEIDARREALEELAGSRFPPLGDPRAQATGKKLGAVLDRPCEVGGKTLKIEKRPNPSGQHHAYRVVIIGGKT